jgi:alkanesulfonate monooxygenase SsuD/methylene tetrahydromethanopterin reductase-like flavin-dependent oxidoreductase (luciferase family)
MRFLLQTEGGVDHFAGDQLARIPQRYEEVIAEAKLADEVGFDAFGCGEQHFDPPYWTISNPETMLAAVARETKRIRLRSTIFLLPFSHPIRLAEAIGTLDIVSGGRLELGTGRGNNSRALRGFQVPFEEQDDRFAEALAIIKGALSQDSFSFSGKYYQFEDLQILPKSIQRPYPPLYYAAISPESHRLAAREGLGLLTLGSAMSPEQVKKRFALYNDNFVDGPGALRKISMSVHTFCAENDDAALEKYRDSVLKYLQRTVFLYEKTLREKGLELDFSNTKSIIQDYQFMVDNNLIAAGSPEKVIETYQYYKELGVNEIRVRSDGLPHELLMKNIKTLADKVFPHFK